MGRNETAAYMAAPFPHAEPRAADKARASRRVFVKRLPFDVLSLTALAPGGVRSALGNGRQSMGPQEWG